MSEILKKAADYVMELQSADLPQGCVYHNIIHVEEVVAAAKEIGENSGLSKEEMEMVLLAAWFHDTGLIKSYKEHEQASSVIAREFLKNNNYNPDKTDIVAQNIMATRMPQQPRNLMEGVLCDADLAHLGKKGYVTRTELLRAEWEKILNVKYTNIEWLKTNIDFITTHNFHTKYAKDTFDERRNANLTKLRKKLKNEMEQPQEATAVTNTNPAENVDGTEIKKDKKRDKTVDRGIETMFRNTLRTHVEFSGMADKKADIMISVNTLLLTAVIAVLARKLDTNPHLIIPTAIITLVSLTTLIFAILVTRPQVTIGTFTKEDIVKKRANLLFFGNFYKMNLEDFHWGMTEMMSDRDFLYGSMIKDFYYLGKVLGHKYKYLRICYTIFMYGLIISVIAFTIAIMLYPGQTVLGPIID